eukprot:SAG11_NODE_2525_length_3255_cov_1.657795_3_plen_155_part_00
MLVAPLVALRHGTPEGVATAVREIVSVTQTSEMSIACSLAAAAILSKLCAGAPRLEAVQQTVHELLSATAAASAHDAVVGSALDAALGMVGIPHSEVVAELGKGCGVPFCLQVRAASHPPTRTPLSCARRTTLPWGWKLLQYLRWCSEASATPA